MESLTKSVNQSLMMTHVNHGERAHVCTYTSCLCMYHVVYNSSIVVYMYMSVLVTVCMDVNCVYVCTNQECELTRSVC